MIPRRIHFEEKKHFCLNVGKSSFSSFCISGEQDLLSPLQIKAEFFRKYLLVEQLAEYDWEGFINALLALL